MIDLEYNHHLPEDRYLAYMSDVRWKKDNVIIDHFW